MSNFHAARVRTLPDQATRGDPRRKRGIIITIFLEPGLLSRAIVEGVEITVIYGGRMTR